VKLFVVVATLIGILYSATVQAASCTISTTRQNIEIGYSGGYIRVYYAWNAYVSYCGGTLGASDSLTINLTSGGNDTLNACRSGSAFNCAGYQPSSGNFADLTVNAGAGNDVVNWSPVGIPAYIYGGDGADTITGGASDDWLDGEDGCDTVCSMQGDDVIFLGSLFGSDGCAGPSPQNTANYATACWNNVTLGNDTIYGSYGDDYIVGQWGSDFIWGGPGDDQIIGLWSADVIDGGPGDDYIIGGLSSITTELNGGAGDLLIGNDDNDTLIGNPQSGDCLCGDDCYSSSSLYDGDDNMVAWSGNDYICDANTYDVDMFTCGGGTDLWYVSVAGDTRTNCETYSSTACSYCLSWAQDSAEYQSDVALARVGISTSELNAYVREFVRGEIE